MRRRDFLKIGSAAAAGIAPAAISGQVLSSDTSRIQRYVPLGGSGIDVSDIAFGSSRLSDHRLVRYAFERGVTYFDTAESYRGGDSELAVGKALEGVRDQVVIASKTKAGSSEGRDSMMRSLENSLKRLRTDYVDIYFNHAVNSVSRMQNDEWYEFTELAKRQGKIRVRGMSGHGSNLIECLDYSLDNDLVDVVLVAFNFSQDPSFEEQMRELFHYVAIQPDMARVLKKAKSKGVGVAAMKVLMGARLNEIEPHQYGSATFSQAALRWVLASNLVDTAVISMTETSRIDEFLGASGEPRLASGDLPLLARYVAMNSATQCRQGCGQCADSCPEGVAISDVLRVRMYDLDYGDRMLAQTSYAGVDNRADSCLTCSAQPCLGSCPYNIPIAMLTRDTAMRMASA